MALDIDRLPKDELVYELRIRGHKGDGTVAELRKVLRCLLKAEKNPAFVTPAYPYTFAQDVAALEKLLWELDVALAQLRTEGSVGEFKKFESRLAHGLGRLNRCPANDDDEREKRSTLLVRLLQLETELASVKKVSRRMSTKDTSLDISVVDAVGGLEPFGSESSGEDSPDETSESQVKVVPVSQWKLKFSGDASTSVGLLGFLERVEELRFARNVSKGLLFRSAIDLFEGQALVWYRANKSSFSNWDELVVGLRETFLPPFFNEKLYEEIRHRTQGANENISIYVSVMSTLFARLQTKLSESARLKILLRNVAPFYQSQLALVDIRTVNDLVRVCRQLEERKASIEAYVPPPRRGHTYEAELAYVERAVPTTSRHVETRNLPSGSRIVCWNCKKTGHKSFDCPEPRRKLVCFKCNNPGFTAKTCPKCKSGKRAQDTVTGRDGCQEDVKAAQKLDILLGFILAYARGDERPYLEVDILGIKILGLMDSGASCTILGKPGWDLLRNFPLKIKEEDAACTVATGYSCKALGRISVPIKLRDRIEVFDVMVVPELPHTLILGIDFWKRMGVVPDLRGGEWKFSRDCLPTLNAVESSSKLSDYQKDELERLLSQMLGHQEADTVGVTNLVEHVIEAEGPPIKQRCRPISPALQKHVDEQLDEMLRLGIVERSTSPWSSPILLVPKKDGTYRFCVDYRRVNQVSRRDAYPLPNISSILDRLRDARYLSSIDIKSAYWQIPVSESSKQYTAFSVLGRGLFQFRRMPFGLHNAPATWQRFIDRVMGPELEPNVFAYLDDIVIVSETFEEHITVLREVLRRITEAGLTVSKDKCNFCRDELRYLGYVVNEKGLHVDPEKVKAILEIPTPNSVTEVRRIIGMASWYRRFIPQYSSLIAPLTNLLRKRVKFVWSADCEAAWSKVRSFLVSAPILSCPDFNREFVVQTDASNVGLGAVLSQQFDDGERVICYLSRSLTRQERNYSTTEKELLALMWAIEKLRPYLEGTRFTAITDHYSLLWLHSLENPSGRLARWATRLQPYDFRVIHRKGKEHVVPDALSRSTPVVDEVRVVERVGSTDSHDVKDKWYLGLRQKILKRPEAYPRFRVDNAKLFKYVRPAYPDLGDEKFNWKELVPKERREELIRESHDIPTSGHLGTFKTYSRIAQRYTWPKMRTDVARYVRRCETCLRTKPEQKAKAGCMRGYSNISRPWEVISTDIVGPLPRSKSGFNFILVVVDCFSKFTLTFPLRKANARNIVSHLENDVFLLFGVPRVIISDNGVQFRSKEYRGLLDTYQVKPVFTAYYHPQANPTERVNRVIKTMLTSYVSENHRNWDQILSKVTCAVRTAKHEVIGQTPYFVNFGREMNLKGNDDEPDAEAEVEDQVEWKVDLEQERVESRSKQLLRVFRDVRKRLREASERSKKRYDLRHRRVSFYPNQLVWRKNYVLSDASKYFAAKLADKFVGPYLIHKRIAGDIYSLKDDTGRVLRGHWHVKDLKASPEGDEGT